MKRGPDVYIPGTADYKAKDAEIARLTAALTALQEMYMKRTCELTDQFTKQRHETMRLEDENKNIQEILSLMLDGTGRTTWAGYENGHGEEVGSRLDQVLKNINE